MKKNILHIKYILYLWLCIFWEGQQEICVCPKNPPEVESTSCLTQDIVWYNISKLPRDTSHTLQDGISPLNEIIHAIKIQVTTFEKTGKQASKESNYIAKLIKKHR